MTPIKDEVHAIVDAQAAKGLAKYGRLLDGTPTNRSSLRDMAEEAVDLAHYALDAERQIRALLEYVARLEGAIGDVLVNWNGGTPPIERSDTFAGGKVQTYLSPSAAMLDSSVIFRLSATLATSPLSGQPLQKVQRFDWRPIAEATKSEKLVVGRRLESKRWVTACLYKYEAVSMFYTHYHPLSAPPKEGE